MQIICRLSKMDKQCARNQLMTTEKEQVGLHNNWTRSGWLIKWFWLDNYTQLNLNLSVRLHIFSVNFSCFAKLGCADRLISHLNQSHQTKSILKARINVEWMLYKCVSVLSECIIFQYFKRYNVQQHTAALVFNNNFTTLKVILIL